MAAAHVYTWLSNMAEASKVSGEKYRRTFPEYDPVFAVRLEIFLEISFPWDIGNNCSCIYLSGNSTDYNSLSSV